jgi:ethanolamine ammonia-lyase large subunit
VLGLKPAPEFEAWLAKVGLLDGAGRVLEARSAQRLLLEQLGDG